jgi:hypothetical protein
MTPHDFLDWRERIMDATQADAATMLGINRRMLQLYEAGHNPIPLKIALACVALALGHRAYVPISNPARRDLPKAPLRHGWRRLSEKGAN